MKTFSKVVMFTVFVIREAHTGRMSWRAAGQYLPSGWAIAGMAEIWSVVRYTSVDEVGNVPSYPVVDWKIEASNWKSRYPLCDDIVLARHEGRWDEGVVVFESSASELPDRVKYVHEPGAAQRLHITHVDVDNARLLRPFCESWGHAISVAQSCAKFLPMLLLLLREWGWKPVSESTTSQAGCGTYLASTDGTAFRVTASGAVQRFDCGAYFDRTYKLRHNSRRQLPDDGEELRAQFLNRLLNPQIDPECLCRHK